MRAAAWPLSALDGFGDSILAELARTESPVSRPDRRRFESKYSEVLERERSFLWANTLDDPMFVKALLLTNPSACARLRDTAKRRDKQRNKSIRAAEHTLFRQLARAVGTPTPRGLWAGAAHVIFGESDGIEQVSACCCITPDLRPFQQLLRALGIRPAYRTKSSYVLNPTLHPDTAGGWAYLARLDGGQLVSRALDKDPGLASLLAVLADLPPLPIPSMVDEVVGRGVFASADSAALSDTFEQLVDGGVLVGGLDLPIRFDTPWAALDQAELSLNANESVIWRSTLNELRRRCDRLADGVWTATVDDFALGLSEIRICIEKLANALAIPLSLDDATVVHCDMTMPWQLRVGPAQARTLLAALDEYDRHWLRGVSPVAGLRDTTRKALETVWSAGELIGAAILRIGAGPTELGTTWPQPAAETRPQMRARLAAWEDCLRSAGDDVTLMSNQEHKGPKMMPSGCLLASLSNAGHLQIDGVSDMPTTAIARFGTVLDLEPIFSWVRSELAHSARVSGVALAQLQVPFESNPNVLAGPILAPNFIAPWGADPRALSLTGARVGLHGPVARPVIWLKGTQRPQALFFPGAATIGASDSVAWLLLSTGQQEPICPGPNRFQQPAFCEVESERFSPRIRLPVGALLRRRSSVLSAGFDRLRKLRGSERFLQWQHYAREQGWPERLSVGMAGGKRLLIHRDSPLAIESLFKGTARGPGFLVVAEADSDLGLSIPGRGIHVTQVALPFSSTR